jgi:hypothetical protein
VQSGRTGSPKVLASAMKKIWPLKDVTQTARAAYTFSGTIAASGSGWDTLLADIAQVKQNDGSRRDYVGWLSVTFGSGVAGLGYVGEGACIARDDDITTPVHELGHNMGRNHAPCGGASGVDPSYPVASGHLDAQGYDPSTGRVLAAGTYYDIMSYCDPVWVSAYNYKAVQSWLEAHPMSPTTPVAPLPRIIVNGRIKNGRVTLRPLSLVEASVVDDVTPGEYTLTLHGDRTVSMPFSVNRVADGDDDAQFAFLAPVVPGRYAADISLNGTVLTARIAGPAQARQTVEVKPVTGGVELVWNAAAFPFASLSHVGDAGHTTLSLFQEGGHAFISTVGLADGGAFEVSLSDGVQSQRIVVLR